MYICLALGVYRVWGEERDGGESPLKGEEICETKITSHCRSPTLEATSSPTKGPRAERRSWSSGLLPLDTNVTSTGCQDLLSDLKS
ncbi:hypothetical protein LOK49_LG15G02637 [Camellia lanceoleosa]|uniref:Uncharacterized protein n=1 Tax=Camellia lanceoleosa TaxID=1840588 RepID=A0ACC0F6X7_9ERIC|nr:hypothetical protein LOK49_LG15G02637 [Camellia lanceoleosa]